MADTTDAAITSVSEETPQAHGTGEGAGSTVTEKTSGAATEAPKTNGVLESSDNANPEKTTAFDAPGDDAGVRDVPDNGETAVTPAAKATPTSTKKATNGSSRKKSSAVPEHKTKKLNKKASKRMTNLDARPGEYYLARMKGHPPWPSIICDEEMLPMSLLDTRPITTRLPDGKFKKPEYEDGGKRAYERTFPIMFLHTNEFAWMPNTDLSPLDTATCKDTTEKGKSKPLLAAYEKASEHNELKHFKDMLADHQKAVKEDLEAQAERDAKKPSKSKRKSMDVAAEDLDEMDIDDLANEPKPKSRKRKKDVDSDGEEKPAKTPKTGTKLKLSTPKTPVETSTKKKPAKPRASAKKAAKGSDDELIDTPKVEEKPMSPAEAKHKKVLYFRHKLQRGFISRDDAPKEDEMKAMSDFLGELENYPDLEGSIIKTTKIHKVLKAMIKLPSIPLDEEFKFKERSMKLLNKWNETLSNDAATPVADKEENKADSAAPTTNGTAAESNDKDEATAAEAAADTEEEDKDKAKDKIGTTVEGEDDHEAESKSEAAEAPEVDEKMGDAPDIESAPEKNYQPATVEATS